MNAMPFAENPNETETVARLRALTRATTPPARIDTVNDSLEWALTAPLTGVYDANGADVMAPERIIQARLAFCRGERWGSFYQVANPRSPVLGMMNVRYLLSRTPLADAAPFAPAGTLPGRYLYENRAVLPRFYLVSKIRAAGSLHEAAALLRSADFNPADEAVVENGPVSRSAPDAPPGAVEVVEYGLQSVRLRTRAPADQYLVTSETHYPGWHAWVDGRRQPVYYTNAAFRGLWVPAGTHTVTMLFRPDALFSSAAASVLSWLLWMILWWKTASAPSHRAPRAPGFR